ncbi:TonB-dependent receptor [Arcicella aquatica]|uniref:TonB-dependent receptor n=1 Tax=Arcicella aquatica TaxID=217141 RepID=A0ABU5QT08_9BACT|nr:TonB-dependent receptor [Arcicella aquatica]MEA5260232.1 TonB-dependent receptor [Arcicella aquatica]
MKLTLRALILKSLFFCCISISFTTQSFAQNTEFKLPQLSGKVKDSNTGESIVGATIFLDFKKSGVITDSLGNYQLYLPPGEYVIKVSHVGYKPYRTKLTLKADTKLDVTLEDVSKTLEEVIVSSQATRKSIQTPSLGVTLLSIKGIKKLPAMMGEVDIIRSLQTLPGVSSVGEGSNGINVRGGNVDQNLIYIDEAPIFNPTHLFGLFSVFASDAIRELELYKGSIPSRFGGRTASVLDIKMTDPSLEKFKLSGGIGLVSNRAMVEVPIIKEKLSVVVAGRVSFNDFLFKWIGPDNMRNTRANFYDVATKVYFRPNKNNTISLSTYMSKDFYQVDSLFSLENVVAKQTQFDYGHLNFSARWSHYFNTKFSLDVVGVVSNYKTRTYAPDSVNRIDLYNSIDYKNIKVNFDYNPDEKHKINFGASGINYQISPGKLNENVKSRISSVLLPREQSLELGLFVDDEYKANEKLTIQAGIRYAQYLSLGPTTTRKYLDGEPRTASSQIGEEIVSSGAVEKSYGGFEPRLAIKYSLGENSTLKIGYNRMQQFIQLLSNNTTPLPTARWKTADEYIKPQVSDFVSLGVFKTYKDNVWEFSAEGYYRSTQNVVDYISGANLQLSQAIETQLISGKGKSYGLELMLTKKRGELNGWVSYTFARSLQQVRGDYPQLQQISDGNWYASNYDKPHSLNIMMNVQPTIHHSFSFTFAYNTGRPFSSPSGFFQLDNKRYPVYEARNNDRISDYHRLDFSWTITNPSMKEKRWEGSWTFTVYNLYGRKNAYSVFFKPAGVALKPYELSVFANPLISLTYNFKFL